jgi:23S rRNA (pseudouridine1915-N3)-methyltransferase
VEDGQAPGAVGVESCAAQTQGGGRCRNEEEKEEGVVSPPKEKFDSPVKIKVAWIGKTKEAAIQSLTDEYLKRIARYVPVEGVPLRDEAALLDVCGRGSGKKSNAVKSTLVLLDSRGKEISSEQLAEFLRNHQDRNPLPLVFAIGGADGFSSQSRDAAQQVLSLGTMTLAHELARVVLLEQIYRAFTILKGHPYHSGH